MNVLFLTDQSPDYGADGLFDGFVKYTAEYDGICIDYSPKQNLHLSRTESRTFDCDLYHPLIAHDIRELVHAHAINMLVLPSYRDGVWRSLAAVREIVGKARFREWLNEVPIIACDFEDNPEVSSPVFRMRLTIEGLRNNPLYPLYFKRELPAGQLWARHLTFGYPAERLVPLAAPREPMVFYAAQVWEWARGGTRDAIAQVLRTLFPAQSDVVAAATSEDRLSIDDYHARQRRCSVAIVPAGLGWYTNRLFDCVADGCLPIIEIPHRDITGWLQVYGSDAEYFSDGPSLGDALARTLRDPERTFERAKACQRRLLMQHTTLDRARHVVEVVSGTRVAATV